MIDVTHLERVLQDATINPEKLCNHLRTAATYYRHIMKELPEGHTLTEEFERYAGECEGWVEIFEGEE